ncbi:MAG TPA: hypothetical protein VK204_12275, partial [Nocardioidaceae bacterium]|nr:hypothetical protein [Nocardioidaceae bacterium]
IWETSRADEGTISATGANIVARAVMAVADAEQTVTVDGVEYDAEKIKALVAERHELATDIVDLRDRLRRADSHLQARTAALTRVIARDRQETAIVVGGTCYFPGRVREIIEQYRTAKRAGW